MITRIVHRLCLLCSNTNEAPCRLQAARVGPRSVLLKVVVRQFSLSGSHEHLASSMADAFDGEMRNIIFDTMWLLLLPILKYDRAEVLYRTHRVQSVRVRRFGAVANWSFYP